MVGDIAAVMVDGLADSLNYLNALIGRPRAAGAEKASETTLITRLYSIHP
jgi:hypothetical protein